MHPAAVVAICDSVSRRIAQGDCPTEPPQSRETLEEALMELWRWHQRAQVRRDPDDEPTAGNMP